MSTRRVAVPLFFDEADTVVDDPTIVGLGVSPPPPPVPIAVGRDRTRDLDHTLRQPAEARFFIAAAFWTGINTDFIADSIASGDSWVIGHAWAAQHYNVMFLLSDPDVPVAKHMFAWRQIDRRC